MDKIKEFFQHPIIQIALAAGASIIILSIFSKRILPEPLSNLELAFPPLIATLYEGLSKTKKASWWGRPLVGILAILLATALVIILNL